MAERVAPVLAFGEIARCRVEEAVRAAREAGELPSGSVTAQVVLKIDAVGLEHEVTGQIDLPGDD